MTTQLALNLDEGRRRKREGMALAASSNSEWMAQALDDLRVFAAERGEFPMEVYRAYRKLRHLPEPTIHKVWGSFAQIACRAGVIEYTGKKTQAASVKTHGHEVRVYRRAGC